MKAYLSTTLTCTKSQPIPKTFLHIQGPQKTSKNTIQKTSVYEQNKNDERICIALGRAYAGIGDRRSALRFGEKAVELVSVEDDWYRGHFVRQRLIEIFITLGEYEMAIAELLEYESNAIVPLLRFHPLYDPIRGDPRFQQVIEGFMPIEML